MTTSTLLAAGTTAVTSSDFTVAAGQPVRVAMTVTSTTARMTVHSVVLGVESLYAALSQSDPGITISAPGTYRVKRPVLTVASGVEVSTLVENHAELEVGAATGNVAGIADPVTGGVIIPFGAAANTVITKYGVRAYDTCATGITIGATTLAHSLSNERPRFQTYTRKCVLSSGASEIRFASSSFTADQTDKSLSIDVYIENMPSEFLGGSNPYITIQISNTTSLGSNYSRWVFDAGYIRQGWNTLKMRQADTISAVSGTGNLPTGCNHPADIGTGFDWASVGQFFSLTFTNMNAYTVHIDELRRPATRS